jgi:hypothetical protein
VNVPVGVADPWRPFTVGEKARLTAEITASYLIVRWWLRRHTVEQAAESARSGLRPAVVPDRPPAEYQLAWRLGGIVERSLDHLPGDTRCLTRSLVLVRLLGRRGIPTTLIIGVQAAPEFSAHAWVELDGRALLSPIEYAAGRLAEI